MYTNELKIYGQGCKTVEEFMTKLQEACKKHGTEFLLEYRVEKCEDDDERFKVILNDPEKEDNTEMNLCYEVLDWLHDANNYGSVCQLSENIKKDSYYKEEWIEVLDGYIETRNTDDIDDLLAFDPNGEGADPEWKDNVSSYVDMVTDLYNFLLS